MMSKQTKVEAEIIAEDIRYPTLVLRNETDTVGYSVDVDTLTLERVCLCDAWNEDECVCGAWAIAEIEESEDI